MLNWPQDKQCILKGVSHICLISFDEDRGHVLDEIMSHESVTHELDMDLVKYLSLPDFCDEERTQFHFNIELQLNDNNNGTEIMYGYVYFMRYQDCSKRRGWAQRSLVILSNQYNLWHYYQLSRGLGEICITHDQKLPSLSNLLQKARQKTIHGYHDRNETRDKQWMVEFLNSVPLLAPRILNSLDIIWHALMLRQPVVVYGRSVRNVSCLIELMSLLLLNERNEYVPVFHVSMLLKNSVARDLNRIALLGTTNLQVLSLACKGVVLNLDPNEMTVDLPGYKPKPLRVPRHIRRILRINKYDEKIQIKDIIKIGGLPNCISHMYHLYCILNEIIIQPIEFIESMSNIKDWKKLGIRYMISLCNINKVKKRLNEINIQGNVKRLYEKIAKLHYI